MKKGISIIVVLFAVFFISTFNAHAALELRGTDSLGNRLIYDSDLNITWYDFTKWYDSWQNAVNWAVGLDVDFGGNHYTDWRLPSTVDGPYVWDYNGTTTAGYYITSSEMGHLYYAELGNKGWCNTSGVCPQSEWGLRNYGDFKRLQPYVYWSGTQYSADPSQAWYFVMNTGIQQILDKSGSGYYSYDGLYAMAVRPGDVSVVPEPISSILFVTGGTFLAGRRYWKRIK